MSGSPRFEQFFAYRRFQPTLAFTADGDGVLVSTNIDGQYNLWEVPVGGGWPRQLTAFADRTVRAVAVRPGGETIAFAADQQGAEFHQIYTLPAAGGWHEPVTQAPQAQHLLGSGAWSPDGSQLAFAANSRVPTEVDVFVYYVRTGETRLLFSGGSNVSPAGWSPDGGLLAVLEERSFDDTDIHVVDVELGEGTCLTGHDDATDVLFTPGPWAADGSGLFVLSNEGREFVGLAFLGLDGSRRWVDTPDGDVEFVVGDREGRVLVWAVNQRGWSQLCVRDLSTGEDLPTPDLPEGCFARYTGDAAVSADGRYAAIVWGQPRRSDEVYVIDLPTGHARRVTDNMFGGLDQSDLVMPELVAYSTFDDREVPAWLYRAAGESSGPVVVAVHGGPMAQERVEYRPLFQYLVSLGISVLAPNIRGSTGYGKSYMAEVMRAWGVGDLRDLEHAALWLRQQSFADPDRIGVYGGSYGGFATLSCVSRLPEYWAAGVDIVGPSNLVTFAQSNPPHWMEMVRRVVGDPDAGAESMMDRSPITYVDQIRAPLLIIQGANDPRVPKPESDQMVDRLRELDRTVDYVVFDDEGHGFTRRQNELHAYQLTADWFRQHLTEPPEA